MLVGIITEDNCEDILKQVDKYNRQVDVFELRLDYLLNSNTKDSNNIIDNYLLDVLSKIQKPVIFTLRSSKDYGFFTGDEQSRLELIIKLCNLKPEYIDLEHYIDNDFVEEIRCNYPEINIIRSYHDYEGWSDSKINLVVEQLVNKPDILDKTVYKIISYARSGLDCIKSADLVGRLKQLNSNIKITSHCMGELGLPSRILGVIAGNYFTYVNLSDKNIDSAPGVINIKELLEVYNYKKLNNKTKIYALLGSPVKQSKGHIFHNANFKDKDINAVYIKFDVNKEQFKQFMEAVQTSELPFSGFSITMPLKNNAAELVDAQNMTAINTIKLTRSIGDRKKSQNQYNILGTNTDGQGALNAITANDKLDNLNLHGQRICIIGSGGTAEAILNEAFKQRMLITIICRSLDKAKDLLNNLNIDVGNVDNVNILNFDLEHLDRNKFDYIVNTLPLDVKQIEANRNIIPLVKFVENLCNKNTVFMDVNYTNGIVVDAAINIPGYNMFERQAALQFEYWSK